MMSALHGHISDSPTLNLYVWALSLLCPVLNLNRITCSVLFSLWRLTANCHRLVGLVVRASASRVEDPGFESRLRRDFFSGLSHNQ